VINKSFGNFGGYLDENRISLYTCHTLIMPCPIGNLRPVWRTRQTEVRNQAFAKCCSLS
jgi:hypothetical protein